MLVRRYPPFTWLRRPLHRSISFVVVHFSDEIKHNILCSRAVYEPHNELIIVDNRFNLSYCSLGAAINEGIFRAKHDLVAVVHEDVLLSPDWQHRFEDSLDSLERVDPNWGVLGAVGWAPGEVWGHWSDPHQYLNTLEEVRYVEVACLDEQLLVLNRSKGPVFDPDHPNIHALGLDIINTLKQQGRKAYVIDAPTIHKYCDAEGDLVLSAKDSTKIRRRYSRASFSLWECSDDYIELKWGKRPRATAPLFSLADMQHPPTSSRPLIFTGRGGSGTRLLTDLARGFGVHVGRHVNKSGDTLDIVEAAYKALFQKLSCPNRQQKALSQGLLAWAIQGLCEGRDIGPRVLPDQKEPRDLGPPGNDHALHFGMKLPELMLLIPEILEAAPNSRIVQLIRDPLDASLGRHHPTSRIDHPLGQAILPHAYRALGHDIQQCTSDPPEVRAAISTVYQMETALDAVSELQPHQYHEIRFEDLVEDFDATIGAFSDWLGADQVNPIKPPDELRARARTTSLSDPTLEQVMTIVEPMKRRLGYARDG